MAEIKTLCGMFPDMELEGLKEISWITNKVKQINSVKGYPIEHFKLVEMHGNKRIEEVSLTYFKEGQEVTETYSRNDFFSL